MKLLDVHWEKDEQILSELEDVFKKANQDKLNYMSKLTEWRQLDEGTYMPKPDPETGKAGFEIRQCQAMRTWWVATLLEPFNNKKRIISLANENPNLREWMQLNETIFHKQFYGEFAYDNFLTDAYNITTRDGMVAALCGWEQKKNRKRIKLSGSNTDKFNELDAQGWVTDAWDVKEGKDGEDELEILMHKDFIEKDNFSATIYPMDNVWLDPTTSDINDASFYIIEYQMKKSDLKRGMRSGKYQNVNQALEDGSIESFERSGEEGYRNELNFENKALGRITVREYIGEWPVGPNGESELVSILYTKSHILKKEVMETPDNKPPIVIGYFFRDPDTKYGLGIPSFIGIYQQLLTGFFRFITDSLAVSINKKYIVNSGVFDDIMVRELEANKLSTVIHANRSIKLGEDIVVLEDTPRFDSMYYLIELVTGMMENMMSYGRYNSGMTGKSLNHTATGIMSLLQEAHRKVAEAASRMNSTFIAPIARKWLKYNHTMLEPETIARLTGRTDIFDPSMLAVDFNVNVVTVLQGDAAIKLQQSMTMLQVITPYVTAGLIDPTYIMELLARIFENGGFPDLASKFEAQYLGSEGQVGVVQNPEALAQAANSINQLIMGGNNAFASNIPGFGADGQKTAGNGAGFVGAGNMPKTNPTGLGDFPLG